VRVWAPWSQKLPRQIGVLPGRAHIEEVVCPEKPPADVNVSFEIDWPATFEGKEFQLYYGFSLVSGTFEVEGEIWLERASTGRNLIHLLLNSQGEVNRFTDASYQSFKTKITTIEGYGLLTQDERPRSAHVLRSDSHMRRAVGKYRIQHFMVLSSTADVSDPSRRVFTPVAHQQFENTGNFIIAGNPIFEAKVGGANKWTIEVPESLVEQINRLR